MFAVAGFWQRTGIGHGFTMVTCDANSLVKPIHPKAMITILEPSDIDTWLAGSHAEIAGLQKPFDEKWMRVADQSFRPGGMSDERSSMPLRRLMLRRASQLRG